MKKSFCILLFLGLLFYSKHASCSNVLDNGTDVDSSIVSNNYIGIIESADSIVWYLLDPMNVDSMSLDSTSVNKVEEILLCHTDTLKERINALKTTLCYPQSFVKSDMVKDCTFLPDVAVCFFSGKGVVTFSYSFYCDVCRFEKEGKYQDTDGELIRKAIIQMACENFPKDRYLRNLKRKQK